MLSEMPHAIQVFFKTSHTFFMFANVFQCFFYLKKNQDKATSIICRSKTVEMICNSSKLFKGWPVVSTERI